MRLLEGVTVFSMNAKENEGKFQLMGFLEIFAGVPLDGADRDPVGEPDHFGDPHIQC